MAEEKTARPCGCSQCRNLEADMARGEVDSSLFYGDCCANCGFFAALGEDEASQRWELLTFTAEAGRPVLPDLVLWAFSLNEGDLLAVSREESERFRCRFRSYGERVWTVSEDYSHPWPFIEEMLRLPLAAVGPQGALWLPRQAAALALRPRDPLLLCVDPDPVGTGFTLEPAAGRRVTPRLFLHATYRLPVEAGCRVRLPECCGCWISRPATGWPARRLWPPRSSSRWRAPSP
jgi:hypothetical protein